MDRRADEAAQRRRGSARGGHRKKVRAGGPGSDLTAETIFGFSRHGSRTGDPSWILTLVEAMRAEWGVSLHDAMCVESIPATIVLWPALLSRHGVETEEPKHVERARLAAKERARKWLAANYDIVPTPGGGRRRNSRPPPSQVAVLADNEASSTAPPDPNPM